MRQIVLFAAAICGLLMQHQIANGTQVQVVLATIGCYKPLDMAEIVQAGTDRLNKAHEKRQEGTCPVVLFWLEDFQEAPVENGIRRLMAYPYPDAELSVEEIMRLFSGFSRPPKQAMYIEGSFNPTDAFLEK
jgi:hypothetical protein